MHGPISLLVAFSGITSRSVLMDANDRVKAKDRFQCVHSLPLAAYYQINGPIDKRQRGRVAANTTGGFALEPYLGDSVCAAIQDLESVASCEAVNIG